MGCHSQQIHLCHLTCLCTCIIWTVCALVPSDISVHLHHLIFLSTSLICLYTCIIWPVCTLISSHHSVHLHHLTMCTYIIWPLCTFVSCIIWSFCALVSSNLSAHLYHLTILYACILYVPMYHLTILYVCIIYVPLYHLTILYACIIYVHLYHLTILYACIIFVHLCHLTSECTCIWPFCALVAACCVETLAVVLTAILPGVARVVPHIVLHTACLIYTCSWCGRTEHSHHNPTPKTATNTWPSKCSNQKHGYQSTVNKMQPLEHRYQKNKATKTR